MIGTRECLTSHLYFPGVESLHSGGEQAGEIVVACPSQGHIIDFKYRLEPEGAVFFVTLTLWSNDLTLNWEKADRIYKML